MPVRQFTMQNYGAMLQNYNHSGSWEPLSSTLVSSPMVGWRNTQKLDLRGLLAGKETGVGISNAILQESGFVQAPVAAREAGIFILDMLTTVVPTDEMLADCYRYNAEAVMPGFLHPIGVASLSSEQSMNPSQVIWGLWRFFCKDANLNPKDTFQMRVINSGYIGEGEPMVAPHVYWTRLVFGLDSITASTSYPCLIPSANLVVLGEALDLTVPQELTAMMRSAGR